MKATFGHQTRAPTELINDNTVTLSYYLYRLPLYKLIQLASYVPVRLEVL